MIRLIEISEGGAAILPGGEVSDLVIDICLAYDRIYNERGFVRPWVGYLVVRDRLGGSAEIIGTCGFKSPPVDGRVEISYFTFAMYEGQGLATRMAQELVSIASGADPAIGVYAHTLPHESSSTRILKKAGFTYEGVIDHPEDGYVWEWRLS
ncbi:MAG: GNAT family N-acetyltransferase [Micavibrio sp.]